MQRSNKGGQNVDTIDINLDWLGSGVRNKGGSSLSNRAELAWENPEDCVYPEMLLREMSLALFPWCCVDSWTAQKEPEMRLVASLFEYHP